MRPCPVCHAEFSIPFCVHEGISFARCRNCKSLFQETRPDWSTLATIYQGDYHLRRGHSGDAALEAVKRATTAAYLRLIERRAPPGKRLLEVGCSAGASLEAAAELGWVTQGIELSPEAADVARKRSGGLCVHTGTLLDAPILPGSCDVIALFDVIEHIDPPEETIRAILRALAPGGLVLMVTPDAGSFSAATMKSRWPHLFLEHVIIYSREGLAGLLSRFGLVIDRVGFAWKRVNLNMLVRHATIHPHVAFGGMLRFFGRVVPGFLQAAMIPFNIGEFYLMARKPA